MTTRLKILQSLKECGVLSSAALKPFCGTPGSRGFRYAMSRLVAKGLVAKRVQGGSGGRSIFYQLSQSPVSRVRTAKILGCSAGSLVQPIFRGRDLAHVELCGVAATTLRRMFENAVVLRDFELGTHPDVRNILFNGFGDSELLPDVLLLLKNALGEVTAVAFEVERCRKSDKRIVNKLSHYASHTKLDGMVYLCQADKLSETIRCLYYSRALKNAVRIRHYCDRFLLLGAIPSPQEGLRHRLLDANLTETDLRTWISELQFSKNKKRSLKGTEIAGTKNDEKTANSRQKQAAPPPPAPKAPSVTTPHLHSTNVALHAPVGSGHGRLGQEVAGRKIKLGGINSRGAGSGAGTGTTTTENYILGSNQILGSKNILGIKTKNTEKPKEVLSYD